MRFVIVTCVLISWTGAVAFGQQPSAAIPDQIFYNGKVLTVDSADHVEEAVAVKGEQIFAVGANARIRALAGPKTVLVDLKGHTVIPGMGDNESHEYANEGPMAQRGIDLSGIKSLQEMFDRLRQAVAKAKPGEVIFTNAAWKEADLAEKRGPTRPELDQVSADHIAIVSRGREGTYVNSAALKVLGVTRDTKLVNGFVVPKDASGEPTGHFTNSGAVLAVWQKLVPPIQNSEIPAMEAMMEKLQEEQLAVGLTSITEPDLSPEAMRIYQAMYRDGKLKLRVSMGLNIQAGQWTTSNLAGSIDEVLAPWGVGTGFGDSWLRLEGVGEITIDSLNGPRTFLRAPGSPNNMYITPEQTRQLMVALNHYPWRPHIHIMGDKTLDVVLDAFEAADRESSIRGKRWILDHVPLVWPDQMDRMARLGLVVDADPWFYKQTPEYYAGAYGREHASQLDPMRQLLDHKIVVSTGSDWVAMSNNPFVHLGFYVTRKFGDGKVYGPDQKISREQALRVATANYAYIDFQENVKGSIEEGKVADLVILAQDYLTVPEDQISSIRPLATYVGGKKMWSSKQEGF